MDEEGVTPEEHPSRDAYAGDTEAGELGIGKKDFPLQTSPFTVLLLLFYKKKFIWFIGWGEMAVVLYKWSKKEIKFCNK